MRQLRVPVARAASTNGCSRRLSPRLRTSRLTRGTSAMVIARMTFWMLARVSAISAIASRIGGIAISPSMTRMTMASTVRLKPATRPMTRPTAVLRIATLKPTISETRAP